MGAKIEIWGTPQIRLLKEEVKFSTLTEPWFVKKDLNKFPPRPTQDSRREIRISWSTVSKAEDKSSITKMTESPESVAIKMSLMSGL